jgi:hypothetical protein
LAILPRISISPAAQSSLTTPGANETAVAVLTVDGRDEEELAVLPD